MNRNERLDHHQKFKELAALAQTGALTDSERLDLERHLQGCGWCQHVYNDYALISTEGMSMLAPAYGCNQESKYWDDRPVRSKLFDRIQEAEERGSTSTRGKLLPMKG